MGMFDETARIVCKLDGPGFFHWLLRRFGSTPPLAFQAWDDTRRLASVPGLERTNDVLTILRNTATPIRDVYLITEFETEPRRHQFKRLGVYALLLSMEVSVGSGPEEEPAVGACVLNLTGEGRTEPLKLEIPGTGKHFTLAPLVLNLRQEDAAGTLAAIRDGTLARSILPWIPLMAGGGGRELIDQWKEIALGEPDPERRSVYRFSTLVFAELSRELVNWQQGLEGWNVQESQLILGIKKEGMVAGEIKQARADLLDVIQLRLADPVPEVIRLAVEGTNDPEILRRWLRLAATAKSIQEFAFGTETPG